MAENGHEEPDAETGASDTGQMDRQTAVAWPRVTMWPIQALHIEIHTGGH